MAGVSTLTFLDLAAITRARTDATGHPAALRALPPNYEGEQPNTVSGSTVPEASVQLEENPLFRKPLMPPVILTRPFTPGEKDDIFAPIRLAPLPLAFKYAFPPASGAEQPGTTNSGSQVKAVILELPVSPGSASPAGLPVELAKVASPPLLPDLVPVVSDTLDVEIAYDPRKGKKVLVFSAGVANVGAGDLRVDLEGDHTDTRYHRNGFDFDRPAFQLVSHKNGDVTRIPMGVFYFREGGGHDHYNMRDLLLFRLRREGPDGRPGKVIAENRDGFYFLADEINVRPDIPNAATFPRYIGVDYKDLPGHGLSVGWATYFPGKRGIVGKFVPGHTIDISNLPHGKYILEIVVDPLNKIIESDETNNTGFIEVTI